MDQLIDVDALDAEAHAHRDRAIDAVERGDGGDEQRPQPLAAADRRVAHRAIEPGAGIVGKGEHRLEGGIDLLARSEEHTSELQSLMRISYAVFCLKKKTLQTQNTY